MIFKFSNRRTPPILTTLLACFILTSPSAWSQQPMVLKNVDVVPMDEEHILENRTIVIIAGQISSINTTEDFEIPENALVIDASGKYLMPGLAEMHAHVPDGNASQQYREDVLFLYLANGITLARGMLGDPVHLELRQKLASGDLPGPRLITSGPGLRGGNVTSPAEGIRIVREQSEAGYDFLKIFGGFTVEAFDAICNAAKESEMPFAGHVPGNAGVIRALDSGYATIDHFDAYMPTLVDPEKSKNVSGGFFGYHLAPLVEPERIATMAERTREAKTWNVPTESIMHSAFIVDLNTIKDERPEFKYMPTNVVEGWIQWVTNFRSADDYDQEAGNAFIDVRLNLIKALHDAGAGLLLGSDAPQWFNVPGFSTHREMHIMANAGLSPFEVLQTGTINPAIFLNEENVFGRVAEGLRADLILVDENPLEDLANVAKIAGVIRHGHWYPRETIEEKLAEIAARQ